MSAPAAAAHAGVFAGVDDDVARLAAVAVCALHHQVADDDAAADARAEGQQDHALEVAARADPVLAVGGGVGVVLERDRQAAMMAHPVADGEVVPAGEVDDGGEHSLGDIHSAGRAEADAGDGARSSPASRMARWTASPIRRAASSGPFSTSVGMLSQESGRPRSSTTPTLMLVPPKSMPAKKGVLASSAAMKRRVSAMMDLWTDTESGETAV